MYLIDALKYITWCNCSWCWLSLHTLTVKYVPTKCLSCTWVQCVVGLLANCEVGKQDDKALATQTSVSWCVHPEMLRCTSVSSNAPWVGLTFYLTCDPLYALLLSHSILFPLICPTVLWHSCSLLPLSLCNIVMRDYSCSIGVHLLTQHLHSCQRDHLMSVICD